jgi:hypothetical protein
LKIQRSIRLAAVCALCALALAACNKGATNTNNTNSTSNTNAANTNTTATTTATTGNYSTPTAAFKTLYEAAKANDIEGMKRSMSKKTLELIEKGAAKEKKTLEEAFSEMNKKAPSSTPPTRNEKIDGDKATLEAKNEEKDKWETVPFVKEGGQWKMAFLDEMAAAMEKMDSPGTDKK